MQRSLGLKLAAEGAPLVSPAVPVSPPEEDLGPTRLDVEPLRKAPLWQQVHIDGVTVREMRVKAFLRFLSFMLFALAALFLAAGVLTALGFAPPLPAL